MTFAIFEYLSFQRMRLSAPCFAMLWLSACSSLPQSGPSTKSIQQEYDKAPNGIQLIEVTPQIVRTLSLAKQSQGFSGAFGSSATSSQETLVGVGDILEVTIWEAPPATLYNSADLSGRGAVVGGGSRSTTLPEQTVGAEGKINVPFTGQILVNGRTSNQIEALIVDRLKGKANQPQVLVRILRNNSSAATVVGEVTTNLRFPLTARGEKLLDALAAAGGSKQAVNKTTVQITRGTTTVAMSLDSVIRDAQHNIKLLSGDIITAAYQPLSFTALGATGKNDELNFEAQGITLAQALARAGGLQDARADAQGIFIFRLENANALAWSKTVTPTSEGKIPVIYRIDLKDPASFFVAQSFAVENKDILYVSNAPAADWQKFANLIYTIFLPAVSTVNLLR
jgi:polysaccharide biosynthesis/export protein